MMEGISTGSQCTYTVYVLSAGDGSSGVQLALALVVDFSTSAPRGGSYTEAH